MRLAEHVIALRLLTRHDVAHEGSLAAWLDDLASRFDVAWREVTDELEVRGPARPAPAKASDVLPTIVQDARNVRFRVSLRGEGGVPLVALHAGPHPYSGGHVTWVEARISHATARRVGDDALDGWFASTVTALRPLWAHLHDRDDDAVQNCDSPGMLRLGYGVEVDTVDLASNPGREWNRGDVRLAANWRTYYAAEVVDRLRGFGEAATFDMGHEHGEGRLWRLPGGATEPVERGAQWALREGLGLARAAEKDRWTLGFWQRKG